VHQVIEPVVIAGGGLAGGAAACLLARAGRPVLLLEREATPVTKICGEFISVEASMYLQYLGIDIIALGAHSIERVRLVRNRSMVHTKLPFAGFGLSRRILDEALLRHAASCGAEIRRGQAVSQARVEDGITLELGSAENIRTSTLFLATGKHDLRGLRRRPQTTPEDLVGFKQHFRLSPAQRGEMQGQVDVMLFPDGYAGLLLVEDGIANLCLLTGGERLLRTGGAWPALLQDLQQTAPHLHARLEGAVALETKPVSIYRVPYGFVHAPSSEDPPGVFRLGDQVGVIPSFTGDGMAIALHSAVMATSAYLCGIDAVSYHFRIRRDIAGQIGRAAALYGLAHGAAGQTMLTRLAAIWPSSLALAATLTRISPRALERAVARMPQ
jgi:menaquinone-9 beta-reductase